MLSHEQIVRCAQQRKEHGNSQYNNQSFYEMEIYKKQMRPKPYKCRLNQDRDITRNSVNATVDKIKCK